MCKRSPWRFGGYPGAPDFIAINGGAQPPHDPAITIKSKCSALHRGVQSYKI